LEIIQKKVPLNWNLFLCGDKHTGSRLSHNKGWEKMCDMIMSNYDGISAKHNYCVDHGDTIEAIDIKDPRFEMETIESPRMTQVLNQAKAAVHERKPIQKNLITILKGNHEHKVMRFGNVTKFICEDLQVPYGTYSSVIQYINRGEVLFKHYAHHGFGSIKSIAHPTKRRLTNKQISLMQKFDGKFGDCLLCSMGHTHQLIVASPDPMLYLTTDSEQINHNYTSPKKTAGYIDPSHRWYCNTGSFLKTYGLGYDGYAERAGYDAIDLGFAIVKVRNGKIENIVKVILG